MNAKQIETYNYYKKLYPNAIVLYRIGESYVALSEDAEKVAKSLSVGNAIGGSVFEFPHDDFDTLSKLGESYTVKTISYRNDDGELDFPDICKLEQEKEADY